MVFFDEITIIDENIVINEKNKILLNVLTFYLYCLSNLILLAISFSHLSPFSKSLSLL